MQRTEYGEFWPQSQLDSFENTSLCQEFVSFGKLSRRKLQQNELTMTFLVIVLLVEADAS